MKCSVDEENDRLKERVKFLESVIETLKVDLLEMMTDMKGEKNARDSDMDKT
tara:strand:- start:383 stop:538 length:156 start_codon:yes stop_codon:yes gene_type:complete